LGFAIVGKRIPKISAPDMATGRISYAVDTKLPRMLYGKILRSKCAHARIKSIDISKAQRLSGVEAVITHSDVPKNRFNSTAFIGVMPKDKYVLSEKARYVGDEIAAVAAVDIETAEAAVELIDVEYEELPCVIDPEIAMQPDAPQIHDIVKGNICTPVLKEWGNVEKGFEESDMIFEDKYKTQGQHPAPLEPHVCIANYESGNLQIFTATQSPHRSQTKIAQIFGIPQNKVLLSSPYIGGGFGNKADLILEPIATSLSMRTGKPVRIELTREEMFLMPKRHPSIVRIKTGIRRDGTLVARQVKGILDTGAYSSHGPGVSYFFGFSGVGLLSLYKTPNLKCETLAVYTNTPPSGAFRGYGNPQGAFPLEAQLDQIANELDIDPVELRLKNCVRIGDIEPTTEQRIRSSGLLDCVDKIKKEMKWEQKRKKGIRDRTGIKKKGIGLAFLMHPSGVYGIETPCSAAVRINSDGTVNLQSAATDIGMGLKTTLCQIAAEELGVPIKTVTTPAIVDTTLVRDRGAFGSGGVYVSGMAVKLAAADAKNQLLKKAAQKFDISDKNLDIKRGLILIKNKPKKKALAKIHEVMPDGEIIGTASFQPSFFAPTFGVQCAEIEIDTESGEIKLLKLAYAHDVGKAINPMIVEGQLEGGMVQGLGYTLTENLFIDKKNGAYINTNFIDYKMPRARGVPELKSIIVETEDDTGPFSGKSCGESSLVPTAPAIVNAIFDATGLIIKEIPITSELLLSELKKMK